MWSLIQQQQEHQSEGKFLGPTPDLLNQQLLWGGEEAATCASVSPLGDVDAHSSLGAPGGRKQMDAVRKLHHHAATAMCWELCPAHPPSTPAGLVPPITNPAGSSCLRSSSSPYLAVPPHVTLIIQTQPVPKHQLLSHLLQTPFPMLCPRRAFLVCSCTTLTVYVGCSLVSVWEA